METTTEIKMLQEEDNTECIESKQQGEDCMSLSPLDTGCPPSFILTVDKDLASPANLKDSGESSVFSSITSLSSSDCWISVSSSQTSISSELSKESSSVASSSINSEVMAAHSTSNTIEVTSSSRFSTALEVAPEQPSLPTDNNQETIYYVGLLVEAGVSIQDLLHASPLNCTICSVYGGTMCKDVCHVATRHLNPDYIVHKVYAPHVVDVYSLSSLDEKQEPKEKAMKRFVKKLKRGLRRCLKKAFCCFQ